MFESLVNFRGFARAIGWGVSLGLLWTATPASGQQRPEISDGPPPSSGFNLFARGDYGVAGFRAAGSATFCVTNATGNNSPRSTGCGRPVIFNTPSGSWFSSFETALLIGAPPSDLPPGVVAGDLVGQGYTFTTNATLATRREELLASDRSGRDLLALGVVSTDDGSCRDFRGNLNGGVPANFQLLPHSTCQPTWPVQGLWQGQKRLTLEGVLAAQPDINPTGDGDPFAIWRVPEALQTVRPLGDQATYGEVVDWSVDLLSRYGGIVPGFTGPQQLRGWPLGLTIQFDAFYFSLPTVNNAYFVQALIINESEKVWQQPVDYDSLYIGFQRIPSNGSQFQSFFVDIPRGAWYARNCTDNIPTATPSPYGGGPDSGTCTGSVSGFLAGAQGIMVLKSPLGDLRNKLLSDPTSPFFNPAHPNVGDTITFNHSHGCGFITCTSVSIDFSERSAFGLLSSTLPNLLDGRSPGDFDEVGYFNTVHPSEVWPVRGDFNKFVPGDWDYNHDGIPDTLYFDTCGSNGCVPLWEDTVPGGIFNRVGQVAPMAAGPFALGAGDTTALIFAYFAERDSTAFLAMAQAVYDFYLSFFFGPEAAPSPILALASVGVRGGAQDSSQVRLNWNDRTRLWEDPFLLKLADDIEAADATTQLGKIRDLNAWIVDTLRARAVDNVEAIHVFKSCDGGTTFTDDGNCLPDPVPTADQSSKFVGLGWLPWATLDPSINSVTDASVVAGLSYLYSLVPETRGARFQILLDNGGGPVPTDGSGNPICDPSRCEAVLFEFAPPILSALEKTPDAPGVVSVYVPLSRQAGTVAGGSTVTSPLGAALVPVNVTLTEGVRDGSYRAVFADTLIITSVLNTVELGGGRLDTTQIAVEVTTSGAVPDTFTSSDLVTMRGEVLVSETTVPGAGAGEFVTTTVHRIARASATAAAVPMLLIETTGGGENPLLATGVQEANRTTPGSFVDRADFPGFFIDVLAASGGTFSGQTYLDPDGNLIPNDIVAGVAIAWQQTQSATLAGLFGHYRLDWVDKPYGPGEEFNTGAGLQTRFTESVTERDGAQTSVTDDTLVAKINAALTAAGRTAVPGLVLEAYEMPFSIQNITDGRPVSVAVIAHNATVVLGSGVDTQRVTMPAGKWTPGDRLVLLEMMDVGGVDQLVPTWDVLIGCTGTLLPTCDATNGSAYAAVVQDGVQHDVVYFRRLSSATTFSLDVTAPAQDLAQRGQDLKNVKVVPNPYVFFSRFERSSTDRILKFTNVPPSGLIRIYTLAGQFVQELRWGPNDLIGTGGDLIWDMRTRENTEIAYGLYVYVLFSSQGTTRGKFVVIR